MYFFPAAILFYFVPSVVAIGREHPNQTAISVLNFALGWTLIGWVVALVWSYTYIESSRSKQAEIADSNKSQTIDVNINAKGVSNSMQSSSKKCPFCAEEVKYEAIKCRFCQSELPAVAAIESTEAKESNDEDRMKTPA